jgi:hypothetical protein
MKKSTQWILGILGFILLFALGAVVLGWAIDNEYEFQDKQMEEHRNENRR